MDNYPPAEKPQQFIRMAGKEFRQDDDISRMTVVVKGIFEPLIRRVKFFYLNPIPLSNMLLY